MPDPHVDDAERFIIESLRTRPNEIRARDHDVWIPTTVRAYSVANALPPTDSDPALISIFHDAAWNLARRGILRPSGLYPEHHIVPPNTLYGLAYCITEAGRARLAEFADQPWIPTEPTRYWQALQPFAGNYGEGFEQRAREAARSYNSANYFACCAMCGAASESMLLALAIAIGGDEAAVLKRYRGASGTKNVVDYVANRLRGSDRQQALRDAFNVIAYWRNEAAHGELVPIFEIEAHEALARLLRLAQMVYRHWAEMTVQPT